MNRQRSDPQCLTLPARNPPSPMPSVDSTNALPHLGYSAHTHLAPPLTNSRLLRIPVPIRRRQRRRMGSLMTHGPQCWLHALISRTISRIHTRLIHARPRLLCSLPSQPNPIPGAFNVLDARLHIPLAPISCIPFLSLCVPIELALDVRRFSFPPLPAFLPPLSSRPHPTSI